jgi:uncharacterized protein involved in exopolysaccharide biosynthesis
MSAAQYEPITERSTKDGSQSRDDYVSLLDVFSVLWTGKWVILLGAVIFGVGAFFASWLPEKRYEASVVVSAISEDTNSSGLGALGALASQLGGLVSLPGTGSSRKAESMAILQSEGLTTAFIQMNNLLPVLYPKKWDPAAKRWKTVKDEPTLWMANRLFKTSIRRVSTDLKTGLLTMTITWSDPTTSAQWANGIVAMANDYIRSKAISDGERNISYLNEQLANSNVVAVQNSISALLENEIKKIMLARGSDEYAFKIIDAATVPERPSFPNPTVWAILGSALGILLTSIAILASSRRLRRLMVK